MQGYIHYSLLFLVVLATCLSTIFAAEPESLENVGLEEKKTDKRGIYGFGYGHGGYYGGHGYGGHGGYYGGLGHYGFGYPLYSGYYGGYHGHSYYPYHGHGFGFH